MSFRRCVLPGRLPITSADADACLTRYTELLETLSDNAEAISPSGEQWPGVPAVNISIKLSALCEHLEPAAPGYVSETTRERMRPLLRLAMRRVAFINFDVEQYRYKELVQRTFADVITEDEFTDFPHVGIVVQAYLRDAVQDLSWLAAP